MNHHIHTVALCESGPFRRGVQFVDGVFIGDNVYWRIELSSNSTIDHILRVRQLMEPICSRLKLRSHLHDKSKLEEPERSIFNQATPKLAGLTYGSEEYEQVKQELGVAIDHHYKVNRHHPEHFENGIAGMTLIDLVEMFVDWKAASERHVDGNFRDSLAYGADRFGICEQLMSIFRNTADILGW